MLLATQLWRKATCTERKEYLVDNSQLKAMLYASVVGVGS